MKANLVRIKGSPRKKLAAVTKLTTASHERREEDGEPGGRVGREPRGGRVLRVKRAVEAPRTGARSRGPSALPLLLLGASLSCAGAALAPFAGTGVPDAAGVDPVARGEREGGEALSFEDAAGGDGQGGGAAAASAACPMDNAVPFESAEGGAGAGLLDRGARLLQRATRWVSNSGPGKVVECARLLEGRVASMPLGGRSSDSAGSDALYLLATTEALLGAWARGAARMLAGRVGRAEEVAACALVEKEASERAIAAYTRLRAAIAAEPAPDAGGPSSRLADRWQEASELLAFEYRSANDSENARRVYGELIARGRPTAVVAGHLGIADLAYVDAERGEAARLDVAFAEYRHVLQSSPAPADRRYAWVRLGYALRHRGDVRGVIDAFERAAVRPGPAEPAESLDERRAARSALIVTYAEAGAPGSAFEAFRRVSDHPESAREAVDMMDELGTRYVQLGRLHEAGAAFRELASRDPAHRCAWLASASEADPSAGILGCATGKP